MGYRVSRCRECGGSGETTECGNGPGDRREIATCGRCAGAGEARVWTYPVRPAPGSCGDEAAVRALRELLFAALVGIVAGVLLGWGAGLEGALW